jgi:hypothetical protein
MLNDADRGHLLHDEQADVMLAPTNAVAELRGRKSAKSFDLSQSLSSSGPV